MKTSNRNHTLTSLADQVWMIDEFGLDTAYLVVGTQRALLIDTGSGFGDLKGLVESLTPLPYDVVATHGHLDHIGGKGQFETLFLHPADFDRTRRTTHQERKEYGTTMLATYPNLLGLFDPEQIGDEQETLLLPIGQGFPFFLGDRRIEVIETPGHTAGSICLYDPQSQILFSGDSFMPIFLLLMEGKDRMGVVRTWLNSAERVWERRGDIRLYCGGHSSPLDPQTLPDLIACGHGILDGSLKPERTHIPVFEGMFVGYGSVHIVYDPNELEFIRS